MLAFQLPWAAPFWVTLLVYLTVELGRHLRELRAPQPDRSDDRGSTELAVGLAYGGPMLGLAASRLAGWQMPGAGTLGLYLAGLVVLWTGIGLRWWAVRTLGRFFRTEVVIQPEHRLVTSGPYRLLRHPAYTGALLASAGLGLALGSWLSLALCLLLPLAGYLWRIRIEEQALLRLPGYAEYAARTRRLIPLFW